MGMDRSPHCQLTGNVSDTLPVTSSLHLGNVVSSSPYKIVGHVSLGDEVLKGGDDHENTKNFSLSLFITAT